MPSITLCEITSENWRATLGLAVHPEQQRFVAEHVPIAAIVLAKAFVGPGSLLWTPYAISADDDLIGMLRERAERFFVDNVKADKPPEPDGSESFDNYLSTRFPHRNEAFVSIDTKIELLGARDRLRRVRSELGILESEKETIEQQLKLAIGHDAGLEWTEGKKKSRIYYRLAADGEKTDWHAAYVELVNRVQLSFGAIDHGAAPLIATLDAESKLAQTKVTPGSRRFICPKSWSKNNKED